MTPAPTANLSRVLVWARHRFADRTALVFEDRRWTYAELERDVNALAAALQERDVTRGTRVAVLAMNLPEYLILALALAKLGAVLVPLNYRLHEAELAYLLEHSGSAGLATEGAFSGVADRLVERVPALQTRLALEPGAATGGWEDVPALVRAHAGARVDDAELCPDHLQRIMYTSGTTSRPKGVMLTHGNVNANIHVQIAELELTSADRIANFSPLYHVGGLDIPGFATWHVGGTMVLIRRFEPEQILETFQREGITGTCMVATMIHMIRQLPDWDRYDLAAMRWLIFGQVAPTLFADTRVLFPRARLIEGYGMTEACNGVSYLDAAHVDSKPGSVGTPLPGVDIRVVADDDGDVAPGETGEIVVRGPKVSPGYLDDADANHDAFRGGWFHTGDIGYFDEDGYLYVVDRLKDMIRSGGENMASREIEAVVYAFPAVGEAAVIGVPHDKWLEVPVAVVAARRDSTLDAGALIEHCRSQLGGFKVPKAVYELEALPRNPSGKVLKRELREMVGGLEPAWAAEARAPASGG